MVSQIYNERQRYIIPTSDSSFNKLFGPELNKKLLIGLLNNFIDDKNIKELEYLDGDVPIPLKSICKMSVDVYCKCTDGSNIIVTIQNFAKPALPNDPIEYTDDYVDSYIEGYLEGLEIGHRIFLREKAAKMLEQGISLETISICTGLTPEEISSLKNS